MEAGLGPCSSFSHPVGNQGHGNLSQVKGGQGSEGALTKAVGLDLHLSNQTAFVNCVMLGGRWPGA